MNHNHAKDGKRPSRAATLRCILLVAALAAAALSVGCAANSPRPAARDPFTGLTREWGVRPEAVYLSAGGYMLDFRYRVLDPEKARGLVTDRQAAAYLIDQKSGLKLAVPNPPKVGPLRQTTREPEAGKVYYSMFGNPGKQVARGDLVTVVIGGFRAENLRVE